MSSTQWNKQGKEGRMTVGQSNTYVGQKAKESLHSQGMNQSCGDDCSVHTGIGLLDCSQPVESNVWDDVLFLLET